jgi:hypothetical protein
MSYASQIISSVNNSEPIVSNTNDKSSISQNLSNDKDIGYNTNINEQSKSNNTKSSLKSSSKSSPTSTPLFSYILPFSIFSNFTVFIVLFLSVILILQNYNIKIFGSLGDVMDNVVEIVYKFLELIYILFKPIIDRIYVLIYGTSNELAISSAVGIKQYANTQADFVDELTDPILNDEDNNNKKILIADNLKNDINNKKPKIITLERDDIDSTIQKKTDWCYIGEDQGIKKCVMLGDSKCMSGLVYESNEKCMINIQ